MAARTSGVFDRALDTELIDSARRAGVLTLGGSNSMRLTLFAVLGAGAISLAGCDEKGGAILSPDRPLASVRFINAVPDTLVTDWRFIDQLEHSPYEVGFAFRSLTDYQGVAPGARVFRVFPGTNDLTTQNALIAETLTFLPDQSYTLIHTGFSRPGQNPADQLLVIQETAPTVAATDVAVRARHLGAGMGNVDIYVSRAGGTTPLPTTPTFANLAYGAVTPYVTVAPVGRSGSIPLAASTLGYSRPTGSFASDGFVVGDQILVAGFPSSASANNARSTITSITEQKTTGPIALAATTTGFTRTAGSFIADGFVPNSWVTVSGFETGANNGRFLISAVTATTLTYSSPAGTTVAEAEGPNRTVTADARLGVSRATVTSAVGARTVVGELVFRATSPGSTTVIAEWRAPPGEPANPAANLQALGGSTQGGSAIMAMLVSASVPGSSAPQATEQSNPPTPSFLAPTFIFAIDKHPR